ncbi:hypothetical protein C8R43DRAFT_353376 [Mycena crocata]|nr:hypothetical protein C8R43DRAFT_353376 [Mycena crocata]
MIWDPHAPPFRIVWLHQKHHVCPTHSPEAAGRIEKGIFTTTASSNPHTIPKLLRVAKGVKIWIEPLLYRTISIHWNRPRVRGAPFFRRGLGAVCKSIERKPAAFFREHVRKLCFVAPENSELVHILTAFGAVTDLMVILGAEDATLLPVLANLPLQRLSVNLLKLFPAVLDFRHRIFTEITHLHVSEFRDGGWATWSGLVHIPHLTSHSATISSQNQSISAHFPTADRSESSSSYRLGCRLTLTMPISDAGPPLPHFHAL